jgi:hypothetical protein
MWRSVLVAAIVYGCGIPGLDGYRPAALDAPLQAFYQQVNKAGQESQKVLASLNEARAGYFSIYMKRAGKQLRAAEGAALAGD